MRSNSLGGSSFCFLVSGGMDKESYSSESEKEVWWRSVGLVFFGIEEAQRWSEECFDRFELMLGNMGRI